MIWTKVDSEGSASSFLCVQRGDTVDGFLEHLCNIRSRLEIRNAELIEQSCQGKYSILQIGLFPPKPAGYVNITGVNVFLVWTGKSFLSLCS